MPTQLSSPSPFSLKRRLVSVAIPAAVLSFAVSGCGFYGNSATLRGTGPVGTKSFEVEPFVGMTLDIPAHVTLERGEAHAVRIHTYENLLAEIEVGLDGKQLRIRSDYHLRADDTPIEVRIVAERLESVQIRGAGRITSVEALSGEVVSAAISGSGFISVPVAAPKVEADISGSGTIQLTGRAEQVKARISGSGTIDTTKIAADHAEATISGSGRIEVHAEETLRARISGSGRILYSGEARPDVSISGSGRVAGTPAAETD